MAATDPMTWGQDGDPFRTAPITVHAPVLYDELRVHTMQATNSWGAPTQNTSFSSTTLKTQFLPTVHSPMGRSLNRRKKVPWIPAAFRPSTQHTRGTAKPKRPRRISSAQNQRLLHTMAEQVRWEEERKVMVADKQKTRKEKADEAFTEMMNQLDSEQGLVQETDEYLALKSQTARRKKETLYKEWTKSVFNPIQSEVADKLAQVSTSSIEGRRRGYMQEYLDTTNKKARGVFRDIIVDGYDPLKSRLADPQIDISRFKDPLKRDLVKHKKETKMIGRMHPEDSIIKPQVKKMLDLKYWDANIDATPYGRYAHMAKNPERRELGSAQKSNANLNFDHYSLSKDQSLVKMQYFPRGKQVDSSRYPVTDTVSANPKVRD